MKAQLDLFCTDAPRVAPDLTAYDVILINTSGGKDSQAMLDELVHLATDAGVADRLVAVHCDLGQVEWAGTRDLAERQARHYGIRFEVVRRELGDLLDQVVARGETLRGRGDTTTSPWPDRGARYCTSDQKTSQVKKLVTRLIAEAGLDRPLRVLSCLGLRAQESPARAKKCEFGPETHNSERQVDRWLPIFDWTEDEVWARIRQSGVEHHPAYDAGMPRLSCCFCVLAGKGALVRAAQLNPALARTYVEIEDRVGFPFKSGLSMRQVIASAEAATSAVAAENWAA